MTEPSHTGNASAVFHSKPTRKRKDAAMQLTNTIFNNDYVKQQCFDSHIKQPAFV